jgi:hypothetical protein
MKKVWVSFWVIVSAAALFAQEADQKQGLTWGGAVKTGVRFHTSNAKDETGKTEGPWFDLYNDDAGTRTRIDLDLAYTKDNYGAVIGLRTNDPFKAPTIDLFRQGYVWADFADKLVNLKVGKIDDTAWATTGPEEFSGDLGGGVRLEIKPVEELNLGFFFNGPDDYMTPAFWQNNISPGLAEHFFLETVFGLKYESRLFAIAAGLRLDGKGDALHLNDDHYTEEDLKNAFKVKYKDKVDKDGWPTRDDWTNKGMEAWAGFGLKAVPNLTFTVEALLANLLGFRTYGWIWLDEIIEYAITDNLTIGIRLDQFIYGNEDTEKAGHKPWFKFEPALAYALTDSWTLGLKVPVAFQSQKISYDIGIKPSVAYTLGKHTSIEGFYLFNINQPDGDPQPDSILKNTVQIDFIWKF